MNNVGFFFPLIMMLTWMVSVASMVRKLVYEREIQLEEVSSLGEGKGQRLGGGRIPCVFGWVPLSQETRALGSRMPCQSWTGDTFGSPTERKRGCRWSRESR